MIGPNIYLCLSYKYGLYKEGTPGLLKEVSKHSGLEKVTVISQYPKDLEVAKNLGLKPILANEFYTKVSDSKLLTM